MYRAMPGSMLPLLREFNRTERRECKSCGGLVKRGDVIFFVRPPTNTVPLPSLDTQVLCGDGHREWTPQSLEHETPDGLRFSLFST